MFPFTFGRQVARRWAAAGVAVLAAAALLLPVPGAPDGPGTARAEETQLVETVVMAAGTDRTSDVDLDTGRDYYAEISGTITVRHEFGSAETGDLHYVFSGHDGVFWWYSKSDDAGFTPTVVSDPRTRPFDHEGMTVYVPDEGFPLAANHSYRFRFRPALPRVTLKSSEFCTVSPFQTCAGQITLKIYDAPLPEDDVVDLVAFRGKVEVSVGNGPFSLVEGPLRLRTGDRIHTGFKSTTKLVFANGAVLDVAPMSFIVIEDAIAGQAKVRALVRSGEVKARVERLQGVVQDFEVKTPTTTASVRGTVFTVNHDPVAGVTLVSVTKGVVDVIPDEGDPVEVTKGRESECTAAGASPPVKRGRAGRPKGGVPRGDAVELVLKKIAGAAGPCGLVVSETEAGAVLDGSTWNVTVTTTLGPSLWTVKKRKVRAADDAARQLLKRCK